VLQHAGDVVVTVSEHVGTDRDDVTDCTLERVPTPIHGRCDASDDHPTTIVRHGGLPVPAAELKRLPDGRAVTA